MVRTLRPPSLPPTSTTRLPEHWGDLVDRAVDQGIVSVEQAARLRTLAPPGPATRSPVEAEGPGRLRAFVAEALGYVGGVLVVVAGATITQQFWADLAGWAHASLLGMLALVLLMAGAMVRGEAGTPLGRMRSLLWLLAVVAAGGMTGVVADELLGLEEAAMAAATFAPPTALAAVLWWRLRRSLQQVAVVVGIVATSTALLALASVTLEDWGGLLVWAIGIAWLALAWGGLVTPTRTATAMGAGLALVGPMTLAPVTGGTGGPLLGLATAGAFVAASVPARNSVLLGLAVVGLLVYVPRVVFELFGDQLGGPLGLLASGGVLLGMAIWVARARQDDPAGR